MRHAAREEGIPLGGLLVHMGIEGVAGEMGEMFDIFKRDGA